MSSFKSFYKLPLLALLAGCGALPASGPYGVDVPHGAKVRVDGSPESGAPKPKFNYALVDITKSVISWISQKSANVEKALWPSNASPEVIKVDVGDTLQVTIYESQSGGLFVPKEAGVRPGNFITLPDQVVDGSGFITVPYVGLVQAAGRTTAGIASSISKSLENKAIEPQVVVSFAGRQSSEVSVIGQVKTATRFPLSFQGDKILDAIAKSGGPDRPGYDTYVTLQRDGKEYTLPFDNLVREPDKNIYLKPNDTVYLFNQPKTFVMYGASELQGSYPFGKRELFLSEAIGLASGIRDTQADPSEIYIYRQEAKENIKGLELASAKEFAGTFDGGYVPVIYKINLRDPEGFFLAQQFPLEDKDVVYIANAESVEFLKFLNILNETGVTKRSLRDAF